MTVQLCLDDETLSAQEIVKCNASSAGGSAVQGGRAASTKAELRRNGRGINLKASTMVLTELSEASLTTQCDEGQNDDHYFCFALKGEALPAIAFRKVRHSLNRTPA